MPLSLLYFALIAMFFYSPIGNFLFEFPFWLSYIKSKYIPIHIANYLDLGLMFSEWNQGWVHTLGFTGSQNISGTFAGGFAGFTGLGLWTPGDTWFIGFAKKSLILYP